MLRSKLQSTVATRRAFILLVAMAVAVDYAFAWFRAPWLVLAVPGAVVLAYNIAVSVALRRGWFAAWVVHVVVSADILALCMFAGLGGPTGVSMIGGIVLVVGGQALGTPEIARRQLAIAVPAYLIGRTLGLRAYGYEVGAGPIAIELACLIVLGALAIAGPAAVTQRIRRARGALGALERGDFNMRLSTRVQDDLGFLAASFNSTAETLGRTVHALHDEIGERERTQVALRESETRLLAAREEAQTMAMRMTMVAEVAGRVIGADSLGALHDVLRDACWQVFGFDAFAVAVFDDSSTPADASVAPHRVQALGESDTMLAGERPEARAIAARVFAGRASFIDADGENPLSKSTLVSPVFGTDAVLGYIALRADRAGAYRRGDVEVLEALAALAATAIRNVMLVDALRDSREAFAYQARHDPLTRLANRARLHERLSHALVGPAGEGVAVLVLDLDGFKRVNDSLGHAAGDALLVEVAARLLSATRGSDVVARLGGDEFAVLLTSTRGPADATLVAERILQGLRAPFVLNGAEAVVGTSVGIALAATDGVVAPGADPGQARVDALLRDADLAMYRAKGAGKGRYAFFEPVMHAEAVGRLELEADLRAALTRGEFRLLYQPIVALESGEVVGTEALARWQHPLRGLVSPADFIPLAEETGLIIPLGRWVVNEACREAARVRAQAGRAVTMTVNVSARQLYDPALVDDVRAALDETGIDPHELVLELTESVMIDRPELARERFAALKALGVRLAIDDFGTGYSALSYLQRFPIDVLKIDRSFVDGLRGGGAQAALARTIVALGEALSLRTVAEGIETPEQCAALRAVGCPFGQGYLFSRPLTAEALAEFLAPTVPAAAYCPPAAALVSTTNVASSVATARIQLASSGRVVGA